LVRASYERRFCTLESQVKRLVSDAESEKGTRQRANMEISANFEKINRRLTAIERVLWMAFGVLLTLEVGMRVIWKV
jgi:hypothetical protein